MRAHPLSLAAAVALAASGLTAAEAAPRRPAPACLQVVDPAGDGLAYGAVESPALDIRSADVATGRKNLVVALRLATLERDATQATGVSYTFGWTVNGVPQSVAYHVYATGGASGRFDADAAAGTMQDEVEVPTVADAGTSTVTWTVPRKLVAALRKPGAKFSGLTAAVKPSHNQRAIGEGRSQVLSGGDTAQSARTYTDLAPTCLKGA